jgi:hypothetical protein
MVNKKGYLRIVEAFIAIMLIAGVMGFIFVQQNKSNNQSDEIHHIERIILEKISNDNELRQAVLDDDINKLNETIGVFIPTDYTYTFRICEIKDICGLERANDYYTKNEIASEEVSISSTLETYNPKKIRIFAWVK